MPSDNQALLLQISADVSSLSKAMKKADAQFGRDCDALARKASRTEQQLSEIFGRPINVKMAANQTALAGLNGVMEEGAAAAGVFGGALEALGPIGIGVAVAMVALKGAMDIAEKATEWSEDLRRTAEKLGVTTDELQAFQYAAAGSGVSIDDMRSGLEGLQTVLGKVQDHLFRSENAVQLKAFRALGINPEDLKSFKTATELLPVIADRIREVRTAAEQTAIAKELGLEQLLPLLKRGGDAVRDLVKEAQPLGAIVPQETVDRMADLGEEMKKADQRAGAAAKTLESTFVPALVAIKNAAADAMLWIAKLVNGPTNSEQWAKSMEAGFQAQASAAAIRKGDVIGAFAAGASGLEALTPQGRELAAQRSDKAAADAFAQARQFSGARPNVTEDQIRAELGKPPLKDYAPPAKSGGGGRGGRAAAPQDHTDELAKLAAEDLARASRERIDAERGLTEDVNARAKAEVEANAAEAAQARLRLDADAAKIEADKTLTAETRKRLLAEIDHARTEVLLAQSAKDELADRNRVRALQQQAMELERQRVSAEVAALRLQASNTPIGGARAALDREAFLKQQAADLDAEKLRLAQSSRPPDKQAEELGIFQSQQATALAGFDKQNATSNSPFAKFIDDAKAAGDLGTQLQDASIKAMDTLNQGLLEAITNGGSLKDVLKRALTTGLSDLLSNGLKGLESNLLSQAGSGSFLSSAGSFASLFAMFGFATGTGAGGAPGGLAIVGERGPELANLPKGSQITPNSGLRSLLNSPLARQTPTRMIVSVNTSYDMRGVSGDDAINARIAQAQRATEARVMDTVKRAMPGLQSQYQYERG